MPAAARNGHGFIGQVLITLGTGGGSFVLAVVTTLLASVYPAWKASRMNIVDALAPTDADRSAMLNSPCATSFATGSVRR